jgi:hypothetical protein
MRKLPVNPVQVLTADIEHHNQEKIHLDYEIYQMKSENKHNIRGY